MRENPLYFPRQKLPTTEKTEEWYKDCVTASENLVILRADGSYEEHRKMQVWEDLDNDIIDENEIERVFNPMGFQNVTFPATVRNYPLATPKIDLLIGEEIKRKFDWSVIAKNEEAHSSLTNMMRDDVLNIMIEKIQKESFNEEETQKQIQDLAKYYKYEFKDLNEIAATRILQYLWRQQVLKEKFSSGFRKALVKGREIYRVDVVGNEPAVEVVDPKTLYYLRKGKSHRIEDADIIVEITYEPIGKIIDEFYDYLKPHQVGELESGYQRQSNENGTVLNHVNGYPLILMSSTLGGQQPIGDDSFFMGHQRGLPYDYEGNVRVVRSRWLGRKKIGRLQFFNEQTGDLEERLVSENYKIKKELGETVKWFWVNEAYEGTCIADKFYVKMQPREIQMRHFDNPSKCFLGYVGTDYGKSLMARMEAYQYLYNIYMLRLEHAIAKYKGPIYELDMSKKPATWTSEQWMYYAEVFGYAIVDSFNEGQEGAATGKLAGSVNNSIGGRVMNGDVSTFVQQLISMLQYIELQMGQISGISKQREGAIDNRETVGGVERSVTQSSHITEKWFFIHDETKKRVLAALLDTAKQLWKNSKSKKLSFIFEDMSRAIIDFNGEDFASSEYDLFITNSTEDQEIRELIKQLSQAAVQNGASLTLPAIILRSDSITEMMRKIQEEEDKRLERNENLKREEIKANQNIAQAQLEDKQAERDLAYYKINSDNDTKLQIAGLSSKNLQEKDNGRNEERKLSLQEQKQLDDKLIKEKELRETERHNRTVESLSKSKI